MTDADGTDGTDDNNDGDSGPDEDEDPIETLPPIDFGATGNNSNNGDDVSKKDNDKTP